MPVPDVNVVLRWTWMDRLFRTEMNYGACTAPLDYTAFTLYLGGTRIQRVQLVSKLSSCQTKEKRLAIPLSYLHCRLLPPQGRFAPELGTRFQISYRMSTAQLLK